MRHSALPSALGALTIGLGAVMATSAEATSLAPLSTEQLVDASTLIVRGQVTEVWAERDGQRRVRTRAQVEVDAVLKGGDPGDQLVVDSLGGTLGGVYTSVASAPRFSPDEDVLLFLERSGDGGWRTVGMVQGKYTVRQDPYARQDIVQLAKVPLELPYDHRFLPLPAEGERVSLADFEARIEDRVARGWDGQPIPGASLETLRAINPVRAEVK